MEDNLSPLVDVDHHGEGHQAEAQRDVDLAIHVGGRNDDRGGARVFGGFGAVDHILDTDSICSICRVCISKGMKELKENRLDCRRKTKERKWSVRRMRGE